MHRAITTSGGRPLNAFQLLMREWSALAPYNFIHAMRLPAPANVDQWRRAATAALQMLAIRTGPVPVEELHGNVEEHFAAELQRPFGATDLPFRFFVAPTNGIGGHWFGIVVDHWISDDASCRTLLQQVYSGYQSETNQAPVPRLEWLPVKQTERHAWREWWSFLHHAIALRRAIRIPLSDPMDFGVGVFRVTLPDNALESIKKLAKECGGTMHDVFLAVTAKIFGESQRHRSKPRRDSVAIGSAVDLRRFEPELARDGFGLCVGQFIVMLKDFHKASLSELIGRVSNQTHRMKAAPNTDVFAPVLLAWRLSRSRRAKATFFLRGMPLAAGLSNVNLTGTWVERSTVEEYRRIGPTAPIIPVLLVITTVRGRIFIDVTFRTAAFTRTEAQGLVQNVVDCLIRS